MFQTFLKKFLYFFGYTDEPVVFREQQRRREHAAMQDEFYTAGAEWTPDITRSYKRS